MFHASKRTARCKEAAVPSRPPADWFELLNKTVPDWLQKWDENSPDDREIVRALATDTIPAFGEDFSNALWNFLGPRDPLLEFSGRKHSVMTCVCLGETDPQTDAEVKMMFDLVRTEIQFANLTANQCAKYWDTNEPKDKAGAYGIQGYGGLFVESLEGSYSNVVGLPIVETCKIFKEKNIGYWLNQ